MHSISHDTYNLLKKYLSFRDFVCLSLTCKRLYNFLHKYYFWELKIYQTFPSYQLHPTLKYEGDYYKRELELKQKLETTKSKYIKCYVLPDDILKLMGLKNWNIKYVDEILIKWYFHNYIQIQCMSDGKLISEDKNLRKIFGDKLNCLENLKSPYELKVNHYSNLENIYGRDNHYLTKFYFELLLPTATKQYVNNELFFFLSDLDHKIKTSMDNFTFYEDLPALRKSWMLSGLMWLDSYVIIPKNEFRGQIKEIDQNFTLNGNIYLTSDYYYKLKENIFAEELVFTGENITLDLNNFTLHIKFIKGTVSNILIKNGKMNVCYPNYSRNPYNFIDFNYSDRIGLYQINILFRVKPGQNYNVIAYREEMDWNIKDIYISREDISFM